MAYNLYNNPQFSVRLTVRPMFGMEILLLLNTAHLEHFVMHCLRVREERERRRERVEASMKFKYFYALRAMPQ